MKIYKFLFKQIEDIKKKGLKELLKKTKIFFYLVALLPVNILLTILAIPVIILILATPIS